ncbi:pheromone A receptor-domain-containing protein [Mycena leptocephala]|nr:pheromone A receptor-domain-containing protein [Mycena leptocephala]KAJ7854227.1 pheromone A receptor-domain-containing protein [Mycena leptocephala]
MSKGSTPRTEVTRHIERKDAMRYARDIRYSAPSLLPAVCTLLKKQLLSIAGLWKHELCRQCYQITSVRTVTKNRAEERSAIHIDLAIGLGIPLLRIPLQYIVEGHRYNIFEDIGCLGKTYETPLPSSSSTCPPIPIGAVSAI